MRKLLNIIITIFKWIKKLCIKIINFVRIYYLNILFFILMTILSIYVIYNWDKCISMKFFEQFDGNNILFLVWLALLILRFHDIEAKGFKLRRNMQRDFNNADSNFRQNMKNNLENAQCSEEANERKNNNEQTN